MCSLIDPWSLSLSALWTWRTPRTSSLLDVSGLYNRSMCSLVNQFWAALPKLISCYRIADCGPAVSPGSHNLTRMSFGSGFVHQKLRSDYNSDGLDLFTNSGQKFPSFFCDLRLQIWLFSFQLWVKYNHLVSSHDLSDRGVLTLVVNTLVDWLPSYSVQADYLVLSLKRVF